MEETLSENLNLPVIGGEIIAYFELNEQAYKDFINESTELKKDLAELFGDEFEQDFIPEWFDVEDFVSEGYVDKVEQYCKKNPARYYQTNWYLEFKFPGPSARYNEGIAHVFSESFEKFIDGFKQSLEKMNTLSKKSFSGSFNKKVGTLDNPLLEVFSDSGEIVLKIWVHSKTYRFARNLKIRDVTQIIEQLEQLPERASKLMKNLETISF